MSDLLDKAENFGEGQMDKQAQPGDSVERNADSSANQEINKIADDAGIPQSDDKMIDYVADKKINEDIPFGK